MTKKMESQIEFLALGQIGVAIHYIKEWGNAHKRGQEYQWKKALPFAILSSITTFLIIYLREDIKDLYPVTRFSAAVIGYLGNSVFFSFVNTVKPKSNAKSKRTSTDTEDGLIDP